MALPVRAPSEITKPKLEAGGKLSGIVPRNIDEIFRLASAIAQSGLAPKDMSTPEKLTVAIMTGLELGLPPMFAINKIAIINGRPTLWGDAIPGLLWGHGFKIEETISGEDDDRTATCVVIRPGGEKIMRVYSVADAKTAGLWSKSGPWKQYPDRMLSMRARAFAARDGAADVLGGLYLKEEFEDVPAEPRDITPTYEFKRRSSAECKRDGTIKKFEQMRREVQVAGDLETMVAIYKDNKSEIDTMYERWCAHFTDEYRIKWEDLGGDMDECPMLPMEERG